MIVEYIHASNPDEIKTYDTEKALRKNPCIKMSQQQFDEFELRNFARDLKKGLVISYRIISTNNE